MRKGAIAGIDKEKGRGSANTITQIPGDPWFGGRIQSDLVVFLVKEC